MFLSLTWAIIADIDISSEVIRCMGDSRFTIWGVFRLLFVKHYAGSFRAVGTNITNKS